MGIFSKLFKSGTPKPVAARPEMSANRNSRAAAVSGPPIESLPDARGSARVYLVRLNKSVLEDARTRVGRSFVVTEAVVQLADTSERIDVVLFGRRVGQFDADDKRGYLGAIKAWGRPLRVTLKAGDHDHLTEWNVWVEIDAKTVQMGWLD